MRERWYNRIKTMPALSFNKLYEGGHMKPLKHKITVSVDADTLQEVKRLAAEDSRTISRYVYIIIKKHVKNMNAQP